MRVLQAIGAFCGLVMLIVGPPMALVTTIGNPWPAEGISLDAPLTDGAIMGALAVLVWVLWAQLMVCIVVEFAAAFTGDRVGGRVPFALGAQQQFARKLVTLILAGSIAVPVLTMASSAMATADAHASTPVSTQAESDPPAEEAEKTSNETRESHASVTVMRGDTLWAIAENELGDGSRWTEIAELNANRDMGDGSTFDSGRLIRPGWELIIPSTSQPAAEQKESNPVDHLVTKGDTLSHIALTELGDAKRWPELFEASKDIDQPHPLVDPDLIYPGQRIVSKDSATTQAANPEPSAKISPTTKGDDSEPLPALESTSQDLIDELNVTQKSSTLPDLTTSALSVPTVEQDDQQLPGWVLPAFLGAGALLAAAFGFRLRQRRAAAARSRECGEVPETTPATVRRTEASIAVAGRPAEQVVAELDAVMAWIATTCLALGRDVPQLNTIEVDATHIALHWHTPEETIDRFTSTNGRMTWVTDRGQEWTLDDVTTDRPWPLVVAIGNDNDATWLLNFESTNVALTGDPDRNTAFIRHVVAGLAHSPWSRQVQLDVDQTLANTTGFNPDRIQVHHNLDDVIAHDAVNVGYDIASRLAEPEARIATARVQGTDPDGWPARMFASTMLLESSTLEQINNREHTAGTAVVAPMPGAADIEIHIDADGQLTAPTLGLTLQAVALTHDDALACIEVLQAVDELDHIPTPNHPTNSGWSQFATVTGELRAEHVTPRGITTLEASTSLLPAPADTYLEAAATTNSELDQIAPQVTATVADNVVAADPTLNTDLADWHDPNSPRPKLRLLGPVTATTSGRALAKRKPFYTELFTYIVMREHGATTEEVAEAFNMTPARVRTDINMLRNWLGTDPSTDETYLPDARKAPGAVLRGIGVYQVPSALVDVDLFRRLRLRAQATGNIDDLVEALTFVTGRPFDQLRPGGWGWLLEGDRADLYMPVAIVDVAHTIVTHALAEHDIPRAQEAIDVAVMAAPDEEIVRLDRAAILTAAGHDDAAQNLLIDEVCNRRDDEDHGPDELSERTNEVFTNRHWPNRKVM